MPSFEQIQKQIADLKVDIKKLPKDELRELPKVLWDDEVIADIVGGFYGKGNGVLVATNKRLVFIDKGMGWGLRVEDFPYNKITSIEYATGLVSGEIVICTAGNKSKIEMVFKDRCKSFAEHVRAMITEHNTPKADSNLLNELERLAKLRESGALTEVEFGAAKAKLLGL